MQGFGYSSSAAGMRSQLRQLHGVRLLVLWCFVAACAAFSHDEGTHPGISRTNLLLPMHRNYETRYIYIYKSHFPQNDVLTFAFPGPYLAEKELLLNFCFADPALSRNNNNSAFES